MLHSIPTTAAKRAPGGDSDPGHDDHGSDIPDDYVSVAQLSDYVAQLPAGTRVNLLPSSMRFRRLTYDGVDQTVNGNFVASYAGGGLTVNFEVPATSSPTAAELLPHLELVAKEHPHAAVTIDQSLLMRTPEMSVRFVAESRRCVETLHNPHRYVALLCDRMTPESRREPALFYEALCGRYNHRLVDAMELFLLGDRWYTEAGLRERHPALAAQPDWRRLFEKCGPARMHLCVADEDAIAEAKRRAPGSMVDWLLPRREAAGEATPSRNGKTSRAPAAAGVPPPTGTEPTAVDPSPQPKPKPCDEPETDFVSV